VGGSCLSGGLCRLWHALGLKQLLDLPPDCVHTDEGMLASTMDDDTRAWRALITQNLEAILAVQEIELAGLNLAIDSLDAASDYRVLFVSRV